MSKKPYDRLVPYNNLPELPPTKDILDTELLLKWGIASRVLAELNKNILRMPNPDLLINTLSLREAQDSTEIENIFTTQDDLYKAVSESIEEDNLTPSTKEVLRYREALWGGYETLMANATLDRNTIISVFQKIKNTTQGFRAPQSQVVIRRGESELRAGEIVYTPPRGEGIIEEKIDNLLDFLKSENQLDPLLKMAVAHYQFEAIHPFIDGNGRTGRILNLLYLVDQRLLSHPVLYLSKYIITHKEDYYHLLSGVTQRNDWKSWLMYMMNAVESTARHSNQVIDDILLQMDATFEHAKKSLKWYSHELNQALFSQPYIKQKTVGRVTGAKSRTTLTKYMAQLVKLGILSVKEDGREVFFVNNDLIRILEK